MRSRNIKPGVFTNEILGQGDPFLTILFEGLWCLADKLGRLEDRPIRIKAEVFPYRESLDIHRYLTELSRLGFILRYEVAGQKLICIENFLKHQTPHHTEKRSILPGPEVFDNRVGCPVTVDSPLTHGEYPPDLLIPDSLIPDSKEQPPPLQASPSGSDHPQPKARKPKAPKPPPKIPAWQQAIPADVLNAVATLKGEWADRAKGATQPDSQGQPVPISDWPATASRLSEIVAEGAALDVLVETGIRAAKEWRDGKWIKAPQHWFGKSDEAPWRAYYSAELTNRQMREARNE